jgi:hypothetical protein
VKQHPGFRGLWHALNALLILALLALAGGTIWEYSTRRYLQGFADALVPAAAPPRAKAQAILDWMNEQRRIVSPSPAEPLLQRDPQNTLNYRNLLRACGSATNAFVNLAAVSGLEARRLLLLDEKHETMHVVAELSLGDRWVVVDPGFGAFLRDARGRELTKEELRDPTLWREAAAAIPGYPPNYTFERTAHVRLQRIPVLGRWLRAGLDRALPDWEERVNWTLAVERPSSALSLISFALLLAGMALRLALGWYGTARLGLVRDRLRDRLARTLRVLIVGAE